MLGFEIRGKEDASLRYDVPKPEAIPGECLVKVKYTGICGSDMHMWRTGIQLQTGGKKFILGHEPVGVVEDINYDGELDYTVGDYVVGRPFYSCGRCRFCREGHESLCDKFMMSLWREGGCGSYAEYTTLMAKSCYKLRSGVDLRIAALAEPMSVAVYDVRQSGVGPGDSVLISGGGTIGALIGLMCQRKGARVLFSEPVASRRAFLAELGFDSIDPTEPEPACKARVKNEGQNFPFVFEVSGAQQSYNLCVELVEKAGTIMIVGVTQAPKEASFRTILVKQVILRGVNMYEDRDFYDAVQIINSGKLDKELRCFVTDVFPLEQAFDAYMTAMDPSGEHVKVLIDCDVKGVIPEQAE